ncbi:MAG: kdpA [Burkholderiales bacterium]|jgi:K+-transporting ATPase ATPase A chain|nr:kdpA [Burkholderiales bacterium]
MKLGYLDLTLFLVILTLGAVILGKYIAAVFSGRLKFLAIIEGPIYRILGRAASDEMSWKEYTVALMIFNIFGIIILFTIQLIQGVLPLNPAHMAGLSWDLALNTAISFVSNTNWQAYSGESTMSYYTQMIGLTPQNFFSAATGLSVLVALIRGFKNVENDKLGNFWRDLTKSVLYILLPVSVIFAIIFVNQGIPQNFSAYQNVNLVEVQKIAKSPDIKTQVLPMGPIASQESIKMVGTNGGGYFNANSAHPYENPTPITNLLEILAMLIIPAALCFSFGRMIGDRRQGYALYIAMTIIFIVMTLLIMNAELKGNPLFNTLHVDQAQSLFQSGGNMEGKEARFGVLGSGLFASATTAASCGAVNAAHDSLMPLGGFVPLFLMQLSEVVYGGVGAGLYSIIVFAILSVFIAGLMIGRTPEYLGKKIESFEMKMVAIIILVVPFIILCSTALSVIIKPGLDGVSNPGAHGLSEVLYAFTSAANNNGSAFAGLNANTVYYNLLLGLNMLVGRFGVIIPLLAIAGSLANKKSIPVTEGTMSTSGGLFICILIGVIIIIGALTYIPALALGPVVEHLLLYTQ